MESPTKYKFPKENNSLCVYVLKKNFEKKKIELEQQRIFEEQQRVLEEQKRMIENDQIFYNEFKKNIERRRQLYEEQKDKENLEQLFKKVHHNGKECTII
jgi:hypothetical protein